MKTGIAKEKEDTVRRNSLGLRKGDSTSVKELTRLCARLTTRVTHLNTAWYNV